MNIDLKSCEVAGVTSVKDTDTFADISKRFTQSKEYLLKGYSNEFQNIKCAILGGKLDDPFFLFISQDIVKNSEDKKKLSEYDFSKTAPHMLKINGSITYTEYENALNQIYALGLNAVAKKFGVKTLLKFYIFKFAQSLVKYVKMV